MSIAQVKQQLISRITYSKRLLAFIHKIENQQISKEEINSFCLDILGKKSPQAVAVLMLFKPLLEELILTYQKMAVMCDGKDVAVATAMLDLSLEDQIYSNKEIIQTFSALSPESLKWAHILSEEQAFFESLRNDLKPLLPAPYQFLKKYFSFMLYNSEYNKFDKHKRQKVNYVINLNFNEGLCYELATQFVFKSSNEFIKKKLHLISGEDNKENIGIMGDEIMASILEKNELIDKYIEQVKINLVANAEWLPTLIDCTFKFYQSLSKIKNDIIAIYKKLAVLADTEEKRLNLQAQFKIIQPKVEKYSAQCLLQKTTWSTYIQEAPKLNNTLLAQIVQKITISEKVLAIYFDEITKAIDVIMAEQNKPTVEEIIQFGGFCEKKLAEIKKITAQHAQYILEHKTLSETLLKQQLLQETMQEKEQRQNYLAQKQQCTLLWNAKVEEQRHAKLKKQLNTTSKEIKLVDPLVLQEKEKNEKLESLRVAESLKHLSPHYIQLMKSIYCAEKGIFYHEVYCLVTNQLHGQIVEHGNGSSHKTIILNNFSTCFITNSQLPTTIKSGVYKPHGKAHESGELCGFNLELIQEALIKARITPEVIELLEQMKLNDSFLKVKIS